MLSRRQINVQRENISSMCRISVKSLLDYACLYTHVDDDCEEFINFCAVFEQLVSHRLRPYQKKVWLPGQGSPRHFWDVLLENYTRNRQFLFESCIPNIEAIEAFKSPKAKLRAFIRVALMEKRLSDYMFCLLDNASLICDSYLDGALLASEEAAVLCGDLIGLNAVDFNFCLKGNENELLGPLEISYSPFLKYRQTLASRYTDDIEMLRLSGKDADEDMHPGTILTESNINDILRLQSLEKNVNQIKEQKDYLEELVRLRERQIKETNIKMENMKLEHNMAERSWQKECRTMDACILELQAELGKLRKQNESLSAQVMSLKQFKQRMEMTEVPLIDMAMGDDRAMDKSEGLVEMEQIEERLSMTRSAMKKKQTPTPSDQRSMISLTSDLTTFQEDSQSMFPLTGSLVDISWSQFTAEAKKYSREETISKTEEHLHSENIVPDKNIREISETEYVCREHSEELHPFKDSEVFMKASTLADSSEYILVSDVNSQLADKDQTSNSEVYTGIAASAKEHSPESVAEEKTSFAPKDREEEAEIMTSNETEALAEEQAWPDASKVDAAVSSSYVVMEDNMEEESNSSGQGQNPLNFENSSEMLMDTPETVEEDRKLSIDSVEVVPEQQNIMATSGSSSGVESEKDEEGVMSEPEIVNPSNSSSDSSDAAWEILSDSESKGEN
ncbi:unnamed protein product [Candidula unifasciata]|uniref:RUN domain-containing protein n=1 Tax=Candidula unifasciata TaxID=100452 RepID=A0A8S3YTY8_9EUPU|nr:unnamed protein product [Candidula unifasciata]